MYLPHRRPDSDGGRADLDHSTMDAKVHASGIETGGELREDIALSSPDRRSRGRRAPGWPARHHRQL